MLGRPASEKRQGSKSREVGAPSVPRALWGFGRGVRLEEVGSRRRPVALRRGMGVGDGLTSTAGAAEQGWRCASRRFIDLQ
jgi:hypothetical protein